MASTPQLFSAFPCRSILPTRLFKGEIIIIFPRLACFDFNYTYANDFYLLEVLHFYTLEVVGRDKCLAIATHNFKCVQN